MKILISAAETSSDAHGAELLKAIQKELFGAVEAYGIGGPKLQAAGLQAVVDSRELMAMGFVEILGHLPRVFRALNEVTRAAKENPPDVAVVIDYPDFHFRLAKRFKKLGIPVVYYIPPKVWVWRKQRVEFLRRYFARVLCIFPFEEEFYRRENMSVKYVGNPLVDELPLSLSRMNAREKLGLQRTDQVVVLMPGSRNSELKAHLELMINSVLLTAQKLRVSGHLKPDEELKILMPFPTTGDIADLRAWVDRLHTPHMKGVIDVRVSLGNSADCLIAADAGLIKSGTSTLEAGLLKCPHAIIYKPSITTQWIFKYLIRYAGPVGLVNLVAGWKKGEPYLVREILSEKVTERALCEELISLLTNPTRSKTMVQGFEKLREAVYGKTERVSPSYCAAREVIEVGHGKCSD
jgi:lipid-A-disaccharide synthase